MSGKYEGMISSFVLCFLMLGFILIPINTSYESSESVQFVSEQSIDEYGDILREQYYQNLGQFHDNDTLFYGEIPEGLISFSKSCIKLWMNEMSNPVLLTFPDSNEVLPIPENVNSHPTHFLLGRYGSFTDVRSFSTIRFENLWQGISLVFRATDEGSKYEFLVSPGANPDDIVIRCSDNSHIKVERDVVSIFQDNMIFIDEGLIAYQGEEEVDVAFVERNMNSFGFLIENYDEKLELIIDPLIYSTYIGGSDLDLSYSVALDSSLNTYITGFTLSSSFPILNGFNDTYSGNTDCFVMKLNATGNGIVYSTFLGGGGYDQGSSIKVDSGNNAFVTGYTTSPDFPTKSAYCDNLVGVKDVFILKLNSTGNGLIFSTYIGGTNEEQGTEIAIDDLGNSYVTGFTESSNFPVKDALYSSHKGGTKDCFVMKLNGTGNGLIYSSYIGGTEVDIGQSITVDSSGCAYVTGETGSSSFPTKNGYDSSYNGGIYDSFVFKLSASGSELIYSTFIGGANTEYGSSIAIDTANNVYVTGRTLSSNFPCANAFDSSYNGGIDIFVLKLDSIRGRLNFSTYIGGSGDDIGNAIAVDSLGNSYITGYSASSNFPMKHPIDSSLGGIADCIVFELDNQGKNLLYSTYIGGSDSLGELGWAITVDSSRCAYVVGLTYASNFPIVDGYDDSRGGGYDGFLFKIHDFTDSDGDNLVDYEEMMIGTDPFDPDSDDDLMPDGWEYSYSLDPLNSSDSVDDPDHDNLSNLEEYLLGSNPINMDSDLDLMPDGWEVQYGLNLTVDDANEDFDYDELVNLAEFQNNTFPNDNDTDDDLMPDGWEVQHGLNPVIDDAEDDADSDGLDNIVEYDLGTLPDDSDSDDDELEDGAEVNIYSTDPANPDSDSDELTDGQEINTYNTDPNDADTDADELEDGAEVNIYSTDPTNPDSDSDGLLDGEEVLVYGTNPNMRDSDGDGFTDYEEVYGIATPTDDDGDGLLSDEELLLGTDPNDADTDNDGLPDGWEVARGLDPLTWTHYTGEAQENANNFLSLGGGLFLISFVSIILVGLVRSTKLPIKLLRFRAFLIPAIVLCIIFITTVPTSVYGTTDPGSNSRTISSYDMTFTLIDNPWFANEVTVSVSTRLTVMFQYIDGTVTIRTEWGQFLGSMSFNFGRGAFITTETDSTTFSVESEIIVLELTYSYYDFISGLDLGDYSLTLSAQQGEADGRNDDQKKWTAVRTQLALLSIGAIMVGVFLPTNKLYSWRLNSIRATKKE